MGVYITSGVEEGDPQIQSKPINQPKGDQYTPKVTAVCPPAYVGRGKPRSIVHREYLHVGKGRDLGFNSAPRQDLWGDVWTLKETRKI